MEKVKRLELVIGRVHLPALLQALERAGVTGYTALHDATGKGDRGVRLGDGLTDVFRNTLVIAAAPVEDVTHIVEAIRPILQEAGGMCLISDALWVKH